MRDTLSACCAAYPPARGPPSDHATSATCWTCRSDRMKSTAAPTSFQSPAIVVACCVAVGVHGFRSSDGMNSGCRAAGMLHGSFITGGRVLLLKDAASTENTSKPALARYAIQL